MTMIQNPMELTQHPERYDKQQSIDKYSKHEKYISCNPFIVIYENKIIIMNQLLTLDFSMEDSKETKLKVK